jgi:hypothetical protein
MTRDKVLRDPEDTPVFSAGASELLRDQTRSMPDPSPTMVTCPIRECVGGRVRNVQETATSYAVVEEDHDLCHGTGMVTKAEYEAWRAAHRGGAT